MTDQLKIDFEKILKKSDFSKNNINFKREQLNKFIENGFPNRKLENWKFLDIDQIIKKNIGELSFYNDYSVTNKIDTSILVNDLEHNKIIFINGRIEKIDFAYEDKSSIEIFDDFEVENKMNNENSLLYLNSALSNKCYKILIKKNYISKKPLIIYHLTNDKMKSKNINLRLDFKLEKNSSLRLIDFLLSKKEIVFRKVLFFQQVQIILKMK